MSTNEPAKRDKKTPWIIAGFAIILLAVATYMNYAPRDHHVGSIAAPDAIGTPSEG